MADINIDKFDETFIYIDVDNEGILYELNDHFSFYVKNYKHMPKYKLGIWDGKWRAFNVVSQMMHGGLIHELIRWALDNDYSLDIDPDIHLARKDDPSFCDVESLMESFNLPFKPYDYQIEAVETILKHRKRLVLSPTSCHAPSDEIYMADMTLRQIKDINVGDYVLGANGKSVKVLKTFKGCDDLYEIKPNGNSTSITVTKEHILPLKHTNYSGSSKSGTVENIRVLDYLNKSNNFKHLTKLQYTNNVIEYDVTPKSKLNPYFIGLYLGDGSAQKCHITNEDDECIDEIHNTAYQMGCVVKTKGIEHSLLYNKHCSQNPIFHEFDKLNIKFGNTDGRIKCHERKFTPECILTPSSYRLELLAGFIDAGGSLSKSNTYYDICVKSEEMIDSIMAMSISLGLRPSKSTKYVNGNPYYRCLIKGDISKIPCRIKQKQVDTSIVRNRNPYCSGFEIISRGYGDFYGIQVSGSLYVERSGMVVHNSGKSFIIYSAIRALLAEIGRPQRRILLVVPTTSLVEQMVGDFAEYSENNEFDAEKMCHKIYSGREKHNKCSVTVSTWQSIYKKGQKWFEHFDAVIVDEAHLASGDCITKLMEKCVNAEFRIGLTGTIEDAEVHEMTLTGLFGRTFETISTKELMDRGMVSKLKIKCILFDHDATTKQAVSKLNYADEIDRIITDDKKNRFVADLALRCKGNTLILFNFVERHGIPLYELVNSLNKQGKKVFLVHGDVSVDERERIRAYTEAHDNVIIIASYGTFSTGINIKNLQNVIFAHPFKSKIKILQSIGRVLRKCATSSKAVLFDLANDFRHKSKVNITMNHFKERLKLYDKSKFEYTIKVLKL